MIYLDNNATTEPDKNMINAVMEVACQWYGNPSSSHYYGQVANDLLDQNRSTVAAAVGCKSNQIIFTSGGTEANNLALNNKNIICSAIEHPSILNTANHKTLCRVDSNGHLDLNHLEDLLKMPRHNQVCLSVMYANNETGVILDPSLEINKLKAKYGFVYHVDAVQAFGKGIDLALEDLGADLLSLSGHKIHAFKGTGALFFKDPSLVSNLSFGGSHEFGLRPGTENQVGIASLAHMCDKITNNQFYQSRLQNVATLRDELETKLADISVVNGNIDHRLPNTTNLSFEAIADVDVFVETLSDLGVFVSGKSACSTGLAKPSVTLEAMFGAADPRLHNSIRLSLSVNTTATDVELACDLIREAVTIICS